MLRLSKFPRISKNVSNQIPIKRFFGSTIDRSGNTSPAFGTGVYNIIYQDAESEQKIDGLSYIDNKNMYWTHECLNQGGKLIFSTNYDLCKEGNKLSNEETTLYWYFSPSMKQVIELNWNTNRIDEVIHELSKWNVLQDVPDPFRDFLVKMGARMYIGVPDLSFDQNVLAAKWFMSAFLTDDPLERSLAKDESWVVGKEVIDNINTIYSGCFDKKSKLSNISSLAGKCDTESSLLNGLHIASNIQVGLESELRKILHPTLYKFTCDSILEYANNLLLEQKYFKKSYDRKEFIPTEKYQHLRETTNGFLWTLGPSVTDVNLCKYINGRDSLTATFGWLTSLENEIASGPRERVGKDFSPSNRTNYLVQQGLDYFTALRLVLDEANTLKRSTEVVIQTMSPERRVHFEHLNLILSKLLDFQFLVGNGERNVRYGWIPVFEK